MLQFTFPTEADVPAAIKPYYAATAAGPWVLQVEGAVPKATVDEFRANNIRLQKELDTVKDQFKDVDPALFKTLKTRADLVDEGKLIKAEGLEAAVEARTKAMKAELEARAAAAENRLAATTQEMGRLKIDQALIAEGTRHGLRPEAVKDFIGRGRDVFRLDDEGNVVAVEEDGKTKKFGAAGTVLSIGEFVESAAKDKGFSHLFAPSAGGGAPGGGTAPGTAANPFKPGATFNLTQQAKLTQTNPTLAAQMRAAAAGA